MAQLIIIVSVLFILFGTFHSLKKRKISKEKRKQLMWMMLVGFVCILVLLGKAHWLTAFIAAGAGLIRGLLPIALRYLPQLGAFYAAHQSSRKSSNSPPHLATSDALTREEACEILGVEADATEADILAAYKKLMQKCHPDRGGTDYLAAKLNAAKNKLLG